MYALNPQTDKEVTVVKKKKKKTCTSDTIKTTNNNLLIKIKNNISLMQLTVRISIETNNCVIWTKVMSVTTTLTILKKVFIMFNN